MEFLCKVSTLSCAPLSPLSALGGCPCAPAGNIITPKVAAPKLFWEGDFLTFSLKPALLTFPMSPPSSGATVADCNLKIAFASQPSELLDNRSYSTIFPPLMCFYQTWKNFDLIDLVCVAEGKPGNLLWCEINKEKRNGETLPIWRPDSGSIFISLSPVDVSSEGRCGRQPVAGDQYSSSLCLVWCGQRIISFWSFRSITAPEWKATRSARPAEVFKVQLEDRATCFWRLPLEIAFNIIKTQHAVEIGALLCWPMKDLH